MTEISIEFTIVTPGSLDPDMHLGLEVKWLIFMVPVSFTSNMKIPTMLNFAFQYYT